jgi:hypothetical protein
LVIVGIRFDYSAKTLLIVTIPKYCNTLAQGKDENERSTKLQARRCSSLL